MKAEGGRDGELTLSEVNFGCIGFLAPADEARGFDPEPEAVPGVGSSKDGWIPRLADTRGGAAEVDELAWGDEDQGGQVSLRRRALTS